MALGIHDVYPWWLCTRLAFSISNPYLLTYTRRRYIITTYTRALQARLPTFLYTSSHLGLRLLYDVCTLATRSVAAFHPFCFAPPSEQTADAVVSSARLIVIVFVCLCAGGASPFPSQQLGSVHNAIPREFVDVVIFISPYSVRLSLVWLLSLDWTD